MRKLLSLCLLLLLASCQSVEVNEDSRITEEEVITVLQDNGINVVEAEFPDNIYGSTVTNVKPATYELNGKAFFIYEFATETDREKATREFAEKTATMELVSASTF
jgi:hypothetical protein